MASNIEQADDVADTRTDEERELDAMPDGYALAVTLRDVARAELAHNPVKPSAPAWRRLVRVCERIAPDAEPEPAEPARRAR